MHSIYGYVRKEQLFNIIFYFQDFLSSFLLEKALVNLGTIDQTLYQYVSFRHYSK